MHEVRILPSRRDIEIGALSSLFMTFQKDVSQDLRTAALGYKTGRRLLNDLYLKVAEKKITITFLKK